MSDLTRRYGAVLVIAMFVLGTSGGPTLTESTVTKGPGTSAGPVTVIAVSRTAQFIGAVSGGSYLFVGLLNGTVLRMDPQTGHVSGFAPLPDGNSAAHLAFYNGSLYVGTEWLHGARNRAPFHVYKIEPTAMGVLGQVPMTSHYANGFIMAFNGFLWAGDGRCTLFKIDPNTMEVKGTVPHVAEDELLFDGVHYWAECKNVVNVLKPAIGMPILMASGSLVFPNRPRGFFAIGPSIYTSGSQDFAVYSMSTSGTSVSFTKVQSLGDGIFTRDTAIRGGLVYVYYTGPGADLGKIQARISVYDQGLRLKAAVPLPGPALGSDASQHTLFTLSGRLYFVTGTSVGFVDPYAILATPITSVSQTSTQVGLTTSSISATAAPSSNGTLLVLLMVTIGVASTAYILRGRAVRPR